MCAGSQTLSDCFYLNSAGEHQWSPRMHVKQFWGGCGQGILSVSLHNYHLPVKQRHEAH
eukprot:m.10091 g.10091  ORF g.10091 m.10091 type:complete len:59 (-) comp4268_c0_seq2:3267-3443(-)